MGFIAHIRESDGEIQSVEEHLSGVQSLCERFGEKVGLKHLAGLAGMLHDVGKYTHEFKSYILEAVANPDESPKKGSVDHSTAGGKLLYNRYYDDADMVGKILVEWVAMCVLSHHGGLRDFLSPNLSSHFLKRVIEKDLPGFEIALKSFFRQQIDEKDFELYVKEAKKEVQQVIEKVRRENLRPFTLTLIIKYIFSCLIDADRTDTRLFENNEKKFEIKNDNSNFFERSYKRLLEKISEFEKAENASHPINRLRSEMSKQCDKFASKPSGIYTLSIPTGGGKTLASLRYALKHALTYKKDRIIYVLPYTTIIEQNAQIVRDILRDDEHILEHHSNILEDLSIINEEYLTKRKKLELTKDNWESPIIFTTMVQFLNVFYSKGTRNVRRLHNLANSILIFDEVQAVPIKCISLFNEALNFLNRIGNSSIILCTATQPALDFVQNKLHISSDAEIISNLKEVSQSFKRVNLVDCTTPSGMNAPQLKEFILNKMDEARSILVILNTKTAVRNLYQELEHEQEFELYHLSTSMCACHRKEILEDIRTDLKNGKRVVCISTQLIEAGVDISFECVVRSLAGLDSIAQAAGRCNRHGESDIRNVYIIKSAEEVLTNLPEIKIGGEITERILHEFKKCPEVFGNDLLSSEAIQIYFRYYYHQIQNELNYPIRELNKNLYDLLGNNKDLYTAYFHKYHKKFPLVNRQSFATAESYFEVIDNLTKSLIVPFNKEAKNIIVDLNGDLDSNEINDILKRAQQYVVNVYDHEFKQLDQEGNIDLLLHGNVYAVKETAYTKELGLSLNNEGNWSVEMI